MRLVVGGSLNYRNDRVLDYYRGFPDGGVKYITAAGTNPTADGTSIGRFFADAGIEAEWIPVYSSNCAERTRDPSYVQMVEQADAIYMSGGQAGRVQSCLFGNYSQSGIDSGEVTPLLAALLAKAVVGGSSAGAMNQPKSEILITGHSAESYAAVKAGAIFLRDSGNGFLTNQELVDVHFSERGRQGRLLVLAMQTGQEWAFGVDEDTAYAWRPSGVYEVLGAGGVVVYQGADGDGDAHSATMHYLTDGDTISPATGEITFSDDKAACVAPGERRPDPPASSNAIFNSAGMPYKAISIAMAKTEPGTALDNYHGSPAVQVRFTSTAATRAFCGASGESFAGLAVEQFSASMREGFVNMVASELPLDYMYEIDA